LHALVAGNAHSRLDVAPDGCNDGVNVDARMIVDEDDDDDTATNGTAKSEMEVSATILRSMRNGFYGGVVLGIGLFVVISYQ
jgi:hypothetical protein